MENLVIRPISLGDADALHRMRIAPGVQETISSVYSERISSAEAFLKSLGDDDHMFVATVAGEIVGEASVSVNSKPRKRHVGVFGIMVHRDWQGKGIGRMLMERVVDLSDNWLMLARLELVVFASNEHAIRLYRSFGFEIEGTLRGASTMNGVYADEHIMGRLRVEKAGKTGG